MISRRPSVRFWAGALLGLGVAGVIALRSANSAVNEVKQIAPSVYFHEGDLKGSGHCNNGWVVFDDYVVVIDANFPSGAEVIIPKIKAITNKPIRFVVDTHHHGDHAYANQVWVDNGAVPVANSGVLEEMKKYETGLFGGPPGRWEDAAKTRADVAKSRLKAPTVLFPRQMDFDDGTRRLELHYLGVAHTHGDTWGWMPKEKVLFTGDACVNGPYNYTGDGNIGDWIKTLEAARRLKPTIVVPGHGPLGDGNLLEDQRLYFVTVRQQAKLLLDAHGSPAEAKAQLDRVRATVEKQPRIKRFVGDFFAAQVEKAYVELGGKPFPQSALIGDHDRHARAHQLDLRSLGAPMQWRRDRLASRQAK